MRALEKRVVEAVSTYLADAGWAPDPRTLAWVIGTAAEATGCVLTVGHEQYTWGRGDGPWLRHEIRYADQLQGVVAVAPESTGPLPEVAAVLALPVTVLRLTEETDRLRRSGDAAARQLVDDRWRAVVEMEHERRRLERDLHDGAQHHLVALSMSLALLEHSRAKAPERLAGLFDRLDTTERVLLDTAAGVLPIALASDGLAAALTEELSGHDDVTLDIGGLRRRYPPVAESAVYFVCLEAVNNAHKHAAGAQIVVTARDGSHGLEFAVTDTGPGFTVPATSSGLNNLTTRVAAVNGSIRVRSAPGRGTSVTGHVPC
jgi:signal transduction histidine kinase